ncbi:ABC transporter permease [Streptomyces sp. 891-h]|uniref:ABC transporter permease n=1 Tax=Streptomyces sp. 891-h TaxID=2720714 RepID=UPI001FA9A1A2|nr:ABC transporter permease [Streptomyces sp. 891-h]UNZ15936.1 ABC transporter permease [Streptomyces sp. 891-h]
MSAEPASRTPPTPAPTATAAKGAGGPTGGGFEPADALTGPDPVPGSALRRELRAAHALVYRECLRLLSLRLHTVIIVLEPAVYLVALGGGLSGLIPSETVGGDYKTFLFPGILAIAVQAPAMSVGIRLIMDRENGYLRETLMAPVRRSTLLCGHCLGGTLMATAQGAMLLLVSGAVGIPYRPVLFLLLMLGMVVTAFAYTTFTLALAVHIRRVETFNTLLGLVTMPLLFLSGVFFPLTALPRWLAVPAALNPLSYAVDAMRRCIAGQVPGLTAPKGPAWAGRQLPVPLEWGLLAALGTGALCWAAYRFGRPE